jgi:carbonic anhydrase
MRTLTKDVRDALSPTEVIEVLRRGNERFQNNLKANRNLLQQVNETSDGQHPMAIVLSCIDSRTGAELVFDQGLGDIFSARIAGNVLNDDILGSMEFACKVAGAKAIVVLGHTKCGAVKGACDGVELGNLSTLLHKIQDAVALEKTVRGDRNSTNAEFVEKVAAINVMLVKTQIIERSPVIAKMIDDGEVALVGGMYDVDSGGVAFYGNQMLLGSLEIGDPASAAAAAAAAAAA